MESSAQSNPIGRKISRLRELRSMKHSALAAKSGISQQAVSKLDQSETLEDEVLEKVALVLDVTPKAIRNFSEETIFSNTFTSHDSSPLNAINLHPTFDKIVELNERLLQTERKKNSFDEKTFNGQTRLV